MESKVPNAAKKDVSKKNDQSNRKVTKALLALPPIPDSMLGQEPQVLDSFAMVPELAKRIENVGQGYAKL